MSYATLVGRETTTGSYMTEDRPTWARRIVAERKARGWSQADAITALRAHSKEILPDDKNMLRQWKRWEAGETNPDRYRPLIAATFGTVEAALFPRPSRRNGGSEVAALSGLEMVELLQRLQASDVDAATVEGVRITTERLCSQYKELPAEQLRVEGRKWLEELVALQARRLNFSQHREILALAGWLALLVGCVEYDMGDRAGAEASRQAALSLGRETDNLDIVGWAHEMRAWIALTSGDLRSAIEASRVGIDVAGNRPVSVQLSGQEAKAWARIGDRRLTEVALERGRDLTERLPYPENLDNHFTVDPAKFDFYAMDCYRVLGEDRMAETLAREVIQVNTDFDGSDRSPMRMAEARLTLGVVAARQGDLDAALEYGRRGLTGSRQSVPQFVMVGDELRSVLEWRFHGDPELNEFNDLLRGLRTAV